MVTNSIQVQVVERMDVTIHLINHHPVDKAVCYDTYSLGSIIIIKPLKNYARCKKNASAQLHVLLGGYIPMD